VGISLVGMRSSWRLQLPLHNRHMPISLDPANLLL
jgi:hypothetical protein